MIRPKMGNFDRRNIPRFWVTGMISGIALGLLLSRNSWVDEWFGVVFWLLMVLQVILLTRHVSRRAK